MDVTWQRAGATAFWFLKEVKSKCSNPKKVKIIEDKVEYVRKRVRL